jgi:hypothetical protein
MRGLGWRVSRRDVRNIRVFGRCSEATPFRRHDDEISLCNEDAAGGDRAPARAMLELARGRLAERVDAAFGPGKHSARAAA